MEDLFNDSGKKKTEISNEGLENIRFGVVEQAVRDYRNLLSGKQKPTADCNIPELERFFRGDWYRALCDYDVESLMREIRRQVEEDKKK